MLVSCPHLLVCVRGVAAQRSTSLTRRRGAAAQGRIHPPFPSQQTKGCAATSASPCSPAPSPALPPPASRTGAIAVGLQSELAWSRAATTVAHVALGALLLWRACRTDLSSPKDISRAYMFSWALFYVEYALLPLFR